MGGNQINVQYDTFHSISASTDTLQDSQLKIHNNV